MARPNREPPQPVPGKVTGVSPESSASWRKHEMAVMATLGRLDTTLARVGQEIHNLEVRTVEATTESRSFRDEVRREMARDDSNVAELAKVVGDLQLRVKALETAREELERHEKRVTRRAIIAAVVGGGGTVGVAKILGG